MKQNKVCNKSTTLIAAQTEGDTGDDYSDAYEDEFYDESGINFAMICQVCDMLLSIRLSTRPSITLVRYAYKNG